MDYVLLEFQPISRKNLSDILNLLGENQTPKL